MFEAGVHISIEKYISIISKLGRDNRRVRCDNGTSYTITGPICITRACINCPVRAVCNGDPTVAEVLAHLGVYDDVRGVHIKGVI